VFKRIALFNHKGGVSKTTTVFNLGWKLAELGYRVVVVDTDPQCNLTGLVMGFRGPTELERFYTEEPARNLFAGLAPAFEARPAPITPVECVAVEGRPGLLLLPGHIRVSEYETTLGIAQELSGSIQALQNLPGSITELLRLTAQHHNADYVLVDMSPGLGAMNQNVFSTSDFFIVPTAPDFFSVMAIDSLAGVVPRWHRWALQASAMPILQDAAYPFPVPHTRFLGTIVQNFRPRAGAPASSFQRWIDDIAKAVRDRLIPAISDAGLTLEPDLYDRAGVPLTDFLLVQVPDFNSLIALSQQNQKPVFALQEEDINRSGVVLEGTLRNRDQFNELFGLLARKVITLTS
jgi:cellulose biosynthesis protein BcsQ